MSKISVVIPALNEEAGIQRTIGAIPRDKLKEMGYELQVLVVDNGSNDGTGELAEAAGAEVIFEPKRGYGQAYKTGFAHASGDVIVTADADGTYPVDDIPRLVGILEQEKLDFITTNRFPHMKNGAMSSRNKVGNFILTLTMKVLFGLNINDSQSGMWMFRRDILNGLMLKSNDAALSQEIKIESCHFLKSRWKEVPIEYRPRVGKAKLGGWKVGLGSLLHLFKKRIMR